MQVFYNLDVASDERVMLYRIFSNKQPVEGCETMKLGQ